MPFLNIFFGADFGQIPLIFDTDFKGYLNFCPPKEYMVYRIFPCKSGAMPARMAPLET